MWMSCAAATDSGFYIGAGAGQTNIQDDTTNPNGAGTINFDARNTAYKAFAGYRLSGLLLFDFAAEAGYVHFGNPSGTALGQSVEYKVQGTNAAGLLIFPLGPMDFFGKAGAMYSTVDKNIGGTTSSKTSTNPFYGAGIGFRIGKFGIRAEYEYFDVSNLNRLQMYSVSGVYQF
jgi:hypothetical protein